MRLWHSQRGPAKGDRDCIWAPAEASAARREYYAEMKHVLHSLYLVLNDEKALRHLSFGIRFSRGQSAGGAAAAGPFAACGLTRVGFRGLEAGALLDKAPRVDVERGVGGGVRSAETVDHSLHLPPSPSLSSPIPLFLVLLTRKGAFSRGASPSSATSPLPPSPALSESLLSSLAHSAPSFPPWPVFVP